MPVGFYALPMADEKPKIGTFREYINRLGPKTSGAGTKLLMGEEDPNDAEKLAFLTKLLEEGKEKIGTLSGETKPEKVVDLLKWLQEGVELKTKEAAQKRAAQTNEVDFALASAWFAQHWSEPRNCPVCKQATWGIAPTFAQIPVSPMGLQTPPRTNPCVAVVCRTCGNTLFFNAVIMGLLPQEEK
jgi:hypothetical protein